MKKKTVRKSNQRRQAMFLLLAFPVLFGLGVFSKSVLSEKQNQSLANLHCCGNPDQADGEFDPSGATAYFLNEIVSPLASPLAQTTPAETAVLGKNSEDKWIDVDLTTQTVRAMEGEREIFRMPASTGKWAPTPTGEYRIWIKLKYTKMSGGSKEKRTYYYLPNVPYVMYFYQGYGLHGTYWHNNFGHPMSHGCINLSIADAEKLFFWASPVLPEGRSVVKATSYNPGTRVIIHGITPRT